MSKDVIVIPDVHGREFWKTAVEGHENDEIVFLGDYLDPYYYGEGIPQERGLQSLREVIEFKKAHPCNVTLLLGNHDLGYLEPAINTCRRDLENARTIKQLLEYNLPLFDIVKVVETENGNILLSHAGIAKEWLDGHIELLSVVYDDPSMLNCMLHSDSQRPGLFEAFCDVSYRRGGYLSYGSCVWADWREFSAPGDLLDGYIHIFGHTQSLGNDMIKVFDNAYCLDCRSAFIIKEGAISTLSKSESRRCLAKNL